MAASDLQNSPMMQHLLDALDQGKDIGHYGRLVFVMVGRFFMDEDEIVGYMTKEPDFDEKQARALYLEVQSRGYNPPKRNKILEWQSQQDFPICPDTNDPNACDVYDNLKFPDEVYDNIQEYYEQQVES